MNCDGLLCVGVFWLFFGVGAGGGAAEGWVGLVHAIVLSLLNHVASWREAFLWVLICVYFIFEACMKRFASKTISQPTAPLVSVFYPSDLKSKKMSTHAFEKEKPHNNQSPSSPWPSYGKEELSLLPLPQPSSDGRRSSAKHNYHAGCPD